MGDVVGGIQVASPVAANAKRCHHFHHHLLQQRQRLRPRMAVGPPCRRAWLGHVVGLVVGLTPTAFAQAVDSDEFVLDVADGPAGIELDEASQGFGNRRVVVRRVTSGSVAEAGGVQAGDLVVSVNGVSLEFVTARQARDLIATARRPIQLVFRNPDALEQKLAPLGAPDAAVRPTASRAAEGEMVTSEIAPGVPGDPRRSDRQVLGVQRTKAPAASCQTGAQAGDLVEISYVARLEDGTPFDGSEATIDGRAIPGRGGDATVYFVLGQQPAGQFPPGWDLGLIGMCAGEERLISVPPALGFGFKGLPRRGIPPNAQLYYAVKLVSVNGDAQAR